MGLRVLQLLSQPLPSFSEQFSDFSTGLPSLKPVDSYTSTSAPLFSIPDTVQNHNPLPAVPTFDSNQEFQNNKSSFQDYNSYSGYSGNGTETENPEYSSYWGCSDYSTARYLSDEEIIPTEFNTVQTIKEFCGPILHMTKNQSSGLSLSLGESKSLLLPTSSLSPSFFDQQPVSPRSPRSPRLGTSSGRQSLSDLDVPPLFGEMSMWQNSVVPDHVHM